MADYFAAENGSGSQGYLIANGNVYPAVSGPYGKGDIAPGDYTYGSPQHLNKSKGEYYTMTDAPSRKAATAERGFRKIHIGKGANPEADFKDPRTGATRSGVDSTFGTMVAKPSA